MAVSNPCLNWEILDNVFYRSRTCYDQINWPINTNMATENSSLDDFNVSIGQFASIIAIYPKTISKFKSIDEIVISSGSGDLIFTISWNFILNPICKIGWSNNNELILVLKSGKYRIYYNYDGDFEEFDILQNLTSINENSNILISDVIFDKIGFTIKTSNNQFIYIQNIQNPSISSIVQFNQLKTNDSIEPYHISSWTIILPPDCTLKSLSNIKLIVFTTAGLLILKPNNNLISDSSSLSFIQKDLLNSISIIKMSPNNNFAALYCSTTSRLFILDGDFQDLLIQHDLNSKPLDLAWCSNDVIVLNYSDYLSLIGPSSNSINFFTNNKSFIKSEIDGLYYLTNNEVNFISKVSKITEDTFKIGSTSPSAILLDSIDYLDKHSPKANDHLEIISNNLTIAIDNCIRASNEEFDIYWQKNLLRAANFGKINLDLYDPTEFVQTCDYLRILNIIRSKEIGFFLTYNQLINLSIEKLIDLLLLRKFHYLCLKIVNFLNLPNYKILTNWACCKLKNSSNLNDNELLSIIYEKLKSFNIDWTKIAKIAFIEGREKLSKNFLTYEPDTSKKIEFLLNINSNNNNDELEYALIKADEDGDVDSLVLILYELYYSLSNVEFFKEINNKENAIGILKSVIYQIDEDNNLLRNFMFQDDDLLGMIIFDLNKISKSNNELNPKDLIKIQSMLNNSKKIQYLSQILKTQIKLLNLQKDDLTTKFNDIKIGDSLIDTINKIIPIDLKLACSIANKFNMSQKQLSFLILKTLSKDNDKFAELYDYATINGGGKSIGFESFCYEFLKIGEKRQAGLYIPLCKNMTTKQRIRAYINCDMWKNAVSEAGSKNEIEILRSMRDNRTGWESKLANDELERLGK